MSKYEYIFFDLDGTLTESGPGIKHAVAVAAKTIGIDETRDDVLQSFIGPPLIQRFMEVYGVDRETAAALQSAYRKYYTEKGVFENSVYDGVPEMLERIKASGKKLVVTTSKPYVYVDLVMERFELSKYFDFVASADLEAGRSTKTQVLEHAFASLGIKDRSKVILVGDRKYDAEGANNFGIDCMGVLYGYGSREELEKEGVKFIAEDPQTVADLLV